MLIYSTETLKTVNQLCGILINLYLKVTCTKHPEYVVIQALYPHFGIIYLYRMIYN